MGAIDKDEFLCEEAIESLQDCCPDLVASGVCGYQLGCSTEVTLRPSEVACIEELECDEAAQQVCERIAVLSTERVDGDADDHLQVCP